jgi:hypothetical protein
MADGGGSDRIVEFKDLQVVMCITNKNVDDAECALTVKQRRV